MKRTDIINHLIKKNNYKRYLEIGVRNPDENLNKIIVKICRRIQNADFQSMQ